MTGKKFWEKYFSDSIMAVKEFGRMLWSFVFARPKEWWYVVRPARAPFWFSLTFFVLVLVNDQVADVLAQVASAPPLLSPTNYVLALAVLAFAATAWYWARAVLYVWFEFTPGFGERTIAAPKTRGTAVLRNLALVDLEAEITIVEESKATDWEPTRRWVARWIGLFPFMAIILHFGFVGEFYYSGFYVVVLALFLAFMVLRRSVALKQIENRRRRKAKNQWQEIVAGLHPSLPVATRWMLGVWVLLLFAVVVACYKSDVTFPQAMGPLGILLFTASPLVALFTFLAYLKDRNTAWWLTPIAWLFLISVVVGFWNDNHTIRKLETPTLVANDPEMTRTMLADWKPHERPDIARYFEQWLEYRFGEKTGPPAEHAVKDYPVFVVAAEGGGIRAAYWTAAVLKELQQLPGGNFACHLFAVSGVSGGSLGGAAFVADIANAAHAGRLHCEEKPKVSETLEPSSPANDVALTFLGNDFLAPTLAGMMTSDLLSRINPFCAPSLGWSWPCLRDRAAYLEHAWEVEWDALMKRANYDNPVRFSGPFHALWTGTSNNGDRKKYNYCVPSLFLNGTWVETGSRTVTSNLVTHAGSGNFEELDDAFKWLDSSIRLSTAVLNSARFTYVSPPGTVRRDSVTRKIVDGGYFENSGAQTAMELIGVIRSVCKTNPLCKLNNIRTVALILTNNPKRSADNWQVDGEQICTAAEQSASLGGEKQTQSTGNFLPEVLSPISTMLNAREARGRLAEAEFVAANGREQTFRLALRQKKDVEFPLGWYLSEEAQKEIRTQAQKAVTECSRSIWKKPTSGSSTDD